MNKFRPNMYQESIYKINYKKLWNNGIRCLLFDVDNTCVGYKEKVPNKELIKLFNKLKNIGFKIIIFSNARKKRLEPFKILEVDINYLSKKPLKSNFIKIINRYNYKKEEIMIIGDQLFTDIYGGNRVGINTCLVNPLTKDDFIITKLFRKIENIIFNKNRGKYYE